jgi:DNA polymerase phi
VLKDPQSYFTFFRSIFSHNLVRCLINHIQDEERFLHRAAVKSLKVLALTVEKNSYTLVEILPRLIGDNGTYNFDKVTKTKTIEKLLGSVDNSNATEVIDILLAPALNVERYCKFSEVQIHQLTVPVLMRWLKQKCAEHYWVITY